MWSTCPFHGLNPFLHHAQMGPSLRSTSSLRSPWPAFASVDGVIAEKAFSLPAFLFFCDLILLGVGVVPGPGYIPLGFILGWHDQFYWSSSEGVFLAESGHYGWHVARVFATEPVCEVPEQFLCYVLERPGRATCTSVVFAPPSDEPSESLYLDAE